MPEAQNQSPADDEQMGQDQSCQKLSEELKSTKYFRLKPMSGFSQNN